MRSRLPLLFVPALLSVVHANCFHPNGSQTLEPFHNRCSNDPSSPIYNVCCAIDRKNPPGGEIVGTNWTADLCLSNGLCQNKFINADHPNGGIFYFREECTESEWSKGNCPNFCIQGGFGNGNTQMTPCDGTSTSEKWCCGQTTSCCDGSGAVNIFATLGAGAEPSSSSSSSASPTYMSSSVTIHTSMTTLAGQSFTSSPYPPTTSPPTSSGLSTGAIVGIGIGSVAAVAAVFGVVLFLMRQSKQELDNPYVNNTVEAPPGQADFNPQYYEVSGVTVTGGDKAVYQMADPEPRELMATEVKMPTGKGL